MENKNSHAQRPRPEEYLERINTLMWETWGVKDYPFGRNEGRQIMEILNEWCNKDLLLTQ